MLLEYVYSLELVVSPPMTGKIRFTHSSQEYETLKASVAYGSKCRGGTSNALTIPSTPGCFKRVAIVSGLIFNFFCEACSVEVRAAGVVAVVVEPDFMSA